MGENPSNRDDREAALGAAMRTLWAQQHGSAPGRVRVLVGPDSVALWVEEVFSPAEQAVTRRPEGRDLMQRYAEQLLAAFEADLRARVEAITGRRIASGNIRPDADTGHVLCFFILGERLPLEASDVEPKGTS